MSTFRAAEFRQCLRLDRSCRFRTAGAGDATVTFHSGTINVSGDSPRGILAWADGNGSATVTTDAGTFINITTTPVGGSAGVYLFSGTATAANGQELSANVASTITGDGRRARGIEACSNADAPIFVTYTGPGITTTGRAPTASMVFLAAAASM